MKVTGKERLYIYIRDATVNTHGSASLPKQFYMRVFAAVEIWKVTARITQSIFFLVSFTFWADIDDENNDNYSPH
jgi:hypothetical protein